MNRHFRKKSAEEAEAKKSASEKSKENRGGTGRGAGRTEIPKGEHKKEITIYIEQDYQDLLGGKKELQKDIKAYVYNRVEEALNATE